MVKKKRSSAEKYKLFIAFWKKARKIFVDFIIPGFLVFIATILSSICSAVDLSLLKWYIWVAIVLGSGLAGLVSGAAKHLEAKQSEYELDAQYLGTFANTSKSVFDFYRLLVEPKLTNEDYLIELLNYINDNVKAILDANAVIDNDLMTTTLMIEDYIGQENSKVLKLIAFAPNHHLNRIKGKFPVGNEYKSSKTEKYEPGDTLPGAPTTYWVNLIDYVENIASPKYEKVEYFKDRPYKSFFSVPITENEDGGKQDKVFAVLNVDSPKENHFVSYDFIVDKIYPALRPQIALIKLMHKKRII